MLPLHPHDPPAVGPYRLHARLGEDACARVYLGSVPGERPVAVRVVRSGYAADPGFRSAFTRLVEGAYGPDGRHVCGVRSADLVGAVPWAAVDRPSGPALADHVREHGPVPADALHALALALAQGLAELHARGRSHGALRPDGVVLTRETALLADAGLERAAWDAGQRAPHPSFSAPEGGAAPAADVFSWAATLSFAASGAEGAPGLPRVPLQLRGLVDACLRRGPDLRPSAADLVRMLGGPADPGPWPPGFLARLEEAAARQEAAVAADGPGRSERPSGTGPGEAGVPDGGAGSTGADTRGRRNGRRAVAAAAAVLALAAVAGAAVWGHRLSTGDGGAASKPDRADTAGLVTEGGCPDGGGFPPPGEDVDGARTTVWETAFSPDGDRLAVTTAEHGLTVWDWRAGEEVARPADSVGLAVGPVFAPTGCTLAVTVPTSYEGRGDEQVRVARTFDLAAGTTAEHLGPQDGPVGTGGTWTARPRHAEGLAFSPDGSRLAVSLERADDRPSVAVIDTGTGARVSEIAEAPVHGTAFADAGRVLTNDGGTITVWDAESGEELHTVRGTSHRLFAAVPGADEVVHLVGDRIVWWDYAARSEVRSFELTGFADAEGPILVDLALSAALDRVYVSWLAPGDDPLEDGAYTTHAFDTETGEDLAAGGRGADGLQEVSVHPGGEVLAGVSAEGRVVLVDPDTLEPAETLF
ncbi:acyl-ACP thioesterase [Nocardiopsis sp. NPDC006198]|uniref:acyl-ACP thioesterase n=1 Tax=Nocardiopsis sp. NPDC006198 TaxID=3154472 RepID=UPI0033B4616C